MLERQDNQDVAIFWDYENCHGPSSVSGYDVVGSIRSMAHKFGSVKLFKAYLELSEQAMSPRLLNLRSELQSSGVSLTDCPHNGRKNVADQMIIVDMLTYAIDRPAPATIVLISGDRDFAYAASVLRLRRYSVVVVSLSNRGAHPSLKAQANTCLDWNADIMGKVEEQSGQRPEVVATEELAKPALNRRGNTTSSATETLLSPSVQKRETKPSGPNRHKRDNSTNQRNVQIAINIDKATQTSLLDTPGSCRAPEILEEALESFSTPSLPEYQIEDASIRTPCLLTPSTLEDIPPATGDLPVHPYSTPPLDPCVTRKQIEVSRSIETNTLPISDTFQPPTGADKGGREEPNSLGGLPPLTSTSLPPSTSNAPLPSLVDSPGAPTQAVAVGETSTTERVEIVKHLTVVLRQTPNFVTTHELDPVAVNQPDELPTLTRTNTSPILDTSETPDGVTLEGDKKETKSLDELLLPVTPTSLPPSISTLLPSSVSPSSVDDAATPERVEAFKKLVVYLRQQRQCRAPRFAVACELVSAGVIVQAGALTFQEYLSLAERYALIEQGGLHAEAWVSLCSQWQVSDEYESILSQSFAQSSSNETAKPEDVAAENTSIFASQSAPPSLASRSPVISGNSKLAAQRQVPHDIPPGPRANSPDTSSKDNASIETKPTFQLSAQSPAFVAHIPPPHAHSTAAPPIITSGNVAVSSNFVLLVEILRQFRDEGDLHPIRSKVADELLKRNKLAYQQAGATRFGEYVAQAERRGLVKLENKGREHRISLAPTLHSAPRPSIPSSQSPIHLPTPPPVITSGNVVVYSYFILLVEVLHQFRTEDELQPSRSKVADELMRRNKLIYQQAGVERFGEYAALAQRSGLVELGARGSEHWISLAPTVHIAPGRALEAARSLSIPDPSAFNVYTPAPRPSDPQTPRILQVATRFQPLVDIMEQHRLKGVPLPLCSLVSAQLDDCNAYKKAGVPGFQDYIALAKSARIISVHGGTGSRGRLGFDSGWLQSYT